jgi:hypothetical protein
MSLPNPPANVRSADNHIGLEDFYAVPETHQFVYMPTRALWPPVSVDSILPKIQMPQRRNGKHVMLKPSTWLKQFRRVEQITWAPGLPEIIEDRLLTDGGWKERPGAHALNLYMAPDLVHGDAAQAGPWIEHLQLIYPSDAEDITNWCAHRVQHPDIKINFVLVMGGGQGIGKDFLLQALKLTIGAWNFHEISPTDLLSQYTPHVQSVVLRMNEAHDLGDSGRFDRYSLYEREKGYAAAPPDVLPCTDKYIRRYYVPNVLSLVVTTNHKTDGIYLPSDDRRHLVCWSDCLKEQFTAEFWTERWNWLLHKGGASHVAAYLAQRDLSGFNPSAVPRQTTAFFEIVHVSQAPEDAELADVLDSIEQDANGDPKRPDVCSLLSILTAPNGATLEWLLDKKHRRSIPHRMERCGYLAFRNPDTADGLWRIDGKRQTLYVRTSLSPQQRAQAANDYVLRMSKTAGNS